MKRYIFPLILFLVAHGFGVVLYKLSEYYLTNGYSSTVMRVVLGITFFIFVIKYLKTIKDYFKIRNIPKVQIGLI